MFDYDYVDDFVMKIVNGSAGPLQVELHPGEGCGGYACAFCYGRYQELRRGDELTVQDYYRLLDELRGKVSFIALAGIKSDPLLNKHTYDIVKRIKEDGFRLGIHTKGHALMPPLADLLNTATADGDYITFSVDASDQRVYQELHGLQKSPRVFKRVHEAVEYLYRRKLEARSALQVNVSYLLFRENSSREQMEAFVRTFGGLSDLIRFSMPQVPNRTPVKPGNYLGSGRAIREHVAYLRSQYPGRRIVFLEFADAEHRTAFRYCYAQRFIAVIDRCGYLYPCPQVATREFQTMAYGNIKTKGFWDTWHSQHRQQLLDMEVDRLGCRVCDRRDESLNIELAKWFDDGRAG